MTQIFVTLAHLHAIHAQKLNPHVILATMIEKHTRSCFYSKTLASKLVLLASKQISKHINALNRNTISIKRRHFT